MCCFLMYVVPESVYLVESLIRVNMSHNCIKELSSLIGTHTHTHTLVRIHLYVDILRYLAQPGDP